MRKRVAAAAVTVLILLAMTGRAEAFDIGYDAGPDGFVFHYTSFPLLGSGKTDYAAVKALVEEEKISREARP